MAKSQFQSNGSKWIRPTRRLALYLRDKFTCLYCKRDLHGARPADVTLDHLVPLSRGGTHGNENLVTSCKMCNSQRQDRDWRAFARMKPAGAEQRVTRATVKSLSKYLCLAQDLRARDERAQGPVVTTSSDEFRLAA